MGSGSRKRTPPHLPSTFSFPPSHLLLPPSFPALRLWPTRPRRPLCAQHHRVLGTELTEQQGRSLVGPPGLAIQMGKLRPREQRGLARIHTSARTRLGRKVTLAPRSGSSSHAVETTEHNKRWASEDKQVCVCLRSLVSTWVLVSLMCRLRKVSRRLFLGRKLPGNRPPEKGLLKAWGQDREQPSPLWLQPCSLDGAQGPHPLPASLSLSPPEGPPDHPVGSPIPGFSSLAGLFSGEGVPGKLLFR